MKISKIARLEQMDVITSEKRDKMILEKSN